MVTRTSRAGAGNDPNEPSDPNDLSDTRRMWKRLGRGLAIVAILLPAIFVVALVVKPAGRDYLSYWSAGQLLAQHSDPYSPAHVAAIERTQGYMSADRFIMRNPPWALFLVLPLGWWHAVTGLVVWTAALMGCLFTYCEVLEVDPHDRIFAYIFAPMLFCLMMGQSSPFLLLGFAVFLRFHRDRPVVAGAALLLMAIKPHLFLVFWPILLVDCVYHRRYRVLAGGVAAIAGAMLFAMYFDPHVWSNYLAMLRGSDIDGEIQPTLSFVLRYLLNVKMVWLQLVPSGAAVMWGLWYYIRNRQIWDWRTHGLLLMLVTILTSPYAWLTDEVVLLPALMVALGREHKPRFANAIYGLLNGVIVIMMIAHVRLPTGAYIWTSSAWLGWYLYCTHGAARETRMDEMTALPLTAGPVEAGR